MLVYIVHYYYKKKKKLFLTNTEMERICVESTNYVRLKGNHHSRETQSFSHDSFSQWICWTTKTRDVLGKTRRLP